ASQPSDFLPNTFSENPGPCQLSVGRGLISDPVTSKWLVVGALCTHHNVYISSGRSSKFPDHFMLLVEK
ncbi:hypothetical protein PJP12_30100, partial [Mycobacterium kansasii]